MDATAEPGEAVELALLGRDKAYSLTKLPVMGRRGEIVALSSNPIWRLHSLDDAHSVPLVREGGAVGTLRQGTYKRQGPSVNELVEQGQSRTFNGAAGLPEAPFLTASRGETVPVPMTKDTVFPRAMHLYGAHFQEVLPDGSLGPLRDALPINRNETRGIAFVAENLGDWLMHCHMLLLQFAGMRTGSKWHDPARDVEMGGAARCSDHGSGGDMGADTARAGQHDRRSGARGGALCQKLCILPRCEVGRPARLANPNANGALPAPRHDRTGHTWQHGDGLLFDNTKLGGEEMLKRVGGAGAQSGMPGFADSLSDQDIWDILAFIKASWPARERALQQQRTEAEQPKRELM